MSNNIEFICAREFYKLLQKRIHYLYAILSMYLRSTYSYNKARLIRTVYCFFRHIDDVLDNDLIVDKPAVEYVNGLRKQLSNEYFIKDCPMSILADYFMNEFKNKYENYNYIKHSMIELIDDMLEDRKRMESRELLPENSLRKLITNELKIAVDIGLIINKSNIRASDILPLIESQAILYTLRDLRKDYENFIINIPVEFLPGASGASMPSFSILVQQKRIKEWLESELKSAYKKLCESKKILNEICDREARIIIVPLYLGLLSFRKKYPSMEKLIRTKYGIK